MDWASLQDFWTLVVDVWRNGVWGIDIADLLPALGVFLLFMMLRNLMTRICFGALKRSVGKTATSLDDAALDAIWEPLRFIPLVMGFFLATRMLEVDERTLELFERVNRSLIAFTLFWALYRLTSPIGNRLLRLPGILTNEMVNWMTKAMHIAFIGLGAATILEMWGIAVAPILAGLGLFGVAIALGAQDLFKNLIAGLFILGERRFHPGDWIHVDGVVDGDVEQIGFRTTTVRQFDKAPVYIPNSQLADNSVINYGRMTHRRIKWVIGLEYRTTTEQLREVCQRISAYLQNNDDFAKPGELTTFVRVDSFGPSSIDIMLYAFTYTTKWGEWLEIKERLAYEVKQIVEEAGAAFAFPSRSLYLETLPDAAEPFPVPGQPTPPDTPSKEPVSE